jgi:hypothetical protein
MGLRDGIDIRTSTGLADQLQDEDLAAGMGSLRRGWAAGRIGNELNPMRTEQLDAEIAGDVPRAATLRDQIGRLEQRQQLYAPEVGRVEDIHGLRDAAGWLGGQVGQGAASMLDPVAVSAGLSAAGRVAGAVPHPMARMAGKAAQGAALVLPGFMAKDQLTGEFIGEAQNDPGLMARTSPQGLRDMAGNYGTLAAIPDSILPGIVGRQLGGFGLGKGISRLSTPARAGLGAVGEGATEALQSAGSQYAQGLLNPDRDTSGDFMENVNSFAGGAVGGAPFSAAGAMADSGYRRVGDTAERLGTKAGEVIDLARETAEPYIAQGIAGAKAQGGKVIDLLAGEDGKVSTDSVTEALRSAVTPAGKLSDDEMSVLKDIPPDDIIADDAKVGDWLNANGEKRLNLVAEKLQAMDDPEAGEMLQRIGAETDPDRQHAALTAAADFLISKSPVGRASSRAEKLAGFSEVAGALLGKAAVGVGKGAVSLGKSVASGVKEGMGKKNAQVEEDFSAWRERTYGVAGKPAAVLVAGGADFNERAGLAAGYTDDMAKKAKFDVRGGRALARQATFNLADMVDTAGADVARLTPRLNRITADFADIYQARAPEVLSQLGKIMGPEAAPAIKHMLAELEQQAAPTGRNYVKETRAALADQMVSLVGVAERAALMKEGINLHDPAQAGQMLDLMEDFADGIGADKSRGMRAALDQRFGKDGVDQIIGLLNGQAEKEQPGSVVDDRGEIEGSDFEKEQGAKAVAKGSGPKVYGFGNGLGVRTNNETRDPFAPTRKTGEDGVVQRPALFKKGQQRSQEAIDADLKKLKTIAERAEWLKDPKNTDATEHRIASVKKQLQDDPEYAGHDKDADGDSVDFLNHDNHDVRARSAHEVMKESGMQPGKILQLYRDYMRMEAKDEKLTEGERKYANQQARLAHSTIVDDIQKQEADAKPGAKAFEFRTGVQDRAAVAEAAEAYFKERFMVVGEQLSNRDPSKMAVTEVLDMHKGGMGLMERARLQDDPTRAVSEANLLVFKSDAAKEGGEVVIPAGKLVKWVREQRGADGAKDFKNSTKDAAYLADVSEGIAALVGSGFVKGLPYKLNEKGQRESFEKGVAPSLRLATKTFGDMQYADRMRRENRTEDAVESVGSVEKRRQLQAAVDAASEQLSKLRADGAIPDKIDAARQELGMAAAALSSYAEARSDEAVAADQARNEDTFTPDPLEEVEPGANGERFMAERKGMTKGDLGRPTMSRDGKYEVNRSGRRNPDPKTDSVDSTPLDFFPARKEGEAPGDFDDQQFLTRQTEKPFTGGPEPKMTAVARAEFRARELMAAFAKDPEAATEQMLARVRSAKRPTYVKPDSKAPGAEQVAGGAHYIAPIAYLVQRDRAAGMNLGETEQQMFDFMRREAATVLLNAPESELSQTQMLNIAKMMSTEPRKVNNANVRGMLEKLAGREVVPMTAKQEPAAKGIMTRAISQRQAYLDNPPADYTTAKAKEIGGWAQTQLDRIKTELATAGGDRTATLEDYQVSLRQMVKKVASVVEGDASLAGFEGSAPEVASAGLPKDQATLSGGSEGRKLNAQGAPDGKRMAAMQRVDDLTGRLNRRQEEADIEWRKVRSLEAKVAAGKAPKELLADIRDQAEYLQAKADEVKPELEAAERELAGRKLNAQGGAVHMSQIDEIAVYGKVFNVGSNSTIVQATAMEHAYGERQKPEGAFYAEGFDEDFNQFSGWYGTMAEARAALKERVGATGEPIVRAEKKFDDILNAQTNGKFSGWQSGPTAGLSRIATQAEMDEATAYAAKVLGPKIKVEFKAITGYSGEFLDATNTIEISTTAAAGTLGTLYHEAMHVFFRDFVKGNQNVQAVFESLVNDPRHLEKLTALLDGYPAAQAQLSSGEERLAYTYQFWKAGLLQVDAKAKTWLQKIGKFFRRVAGMVRDSEKALELFEAFDNGKMSEPSAAGQVIAKALGQGSVSLKMRRNLDGVVQGLAALTMPAGEILNNSLSPTARKLSAMMFTNPGEESHGPMERGLLNARRSVALQYDNLAKRIMEDLSDTDQERVQKYLQSEAELADIPLGAHREAVKGIRNALDRFHQYLTESGLKIGKVEKYYPTVWSVDALLNKKPEFIGMLVTKYAAQMAPIDNDPAKAAERIWKSLVDREGVDAHLPAQREDGVLNPFFASQEMRTLPWLKGADKEAFLDKNMLMTLSRYFTQGAHSAEYTRRFGEGGIKLEITLKKINDELTVASHEKLKRGEIKDEPARAKWLGRQMRDISQSVGAMEGALGKDVSPTMRKFNSWMTVYQNVRLLPMSLFSSFVDPLALVARGAPMAAAYETFVYGMREVFRTWGDAFRDMPPTRAKDEWRKLAEHIGASETAMFSHFVAEQYSSVYMSAGAKKINDKMFVLNGMEAWNRGTRVMATKWAVRFLEQHAGLPDKIHSARWLKELGLDASQLTLDDGKLVTDRHHLMALKGISLDQATRQIAPVHAALNRWVEGAVLTPNAAQRPGWSSDPNYATLFHLKQFSYSFHQTILKRAVNEFKHGNMAPVGALAAFIPTMITADVMKGLIQGGGELPAYMKGMDAGDWFTHGVQRAGLLGIGSIGMDAETDLASLGGPAVEQAIDGMRDGFGEKTLLKAMPLNSLYGEIFKGTAVTPTP